MILRTLFSTPLKTAKTVAVLALAAWGTISCKPASTDKSPAPKVPTPTNSVVAIGNLVITDPTEISYLDYYLQARTSEIFTQSSFLSRGRATKISINWPASDSASSQMTMYLTPRGGTRLNLSGLYSRSSGTWLFVVGSKDSRYLQPISVVRQPYYPEPADSSQRALVFLNANPLHDSVKVLLNNIDLGTVAYGRLSAMPVNYTPRSTDRLITVNARNLNDTLHKSGLDFVATSRMNVVAQYALLERQGGRDTLVYVTQGYGQ